MLLPSAILPEAAFSMTAGTSLLCYAIWERPEDDASNAAWHRETISALDPLAVGHYVGESDIASHPARAERSFARTNWQRLQALRQKYAGMLFFAGTSAHKIGRNKCSQRSTRKPHPMITFPC